MLRREFVTSLCGVLAAFSVGPFAHGQKKRPLIIWISAFAPPTGQEDLKFSAYFLEGMAGLGCLRDRDFTFEFRTGGGLPDLPRLAEEVVVAQPSVIVVPATFEAVALSKATSQIPIVCPALADAVHLGLIESEARPGRNITGIEPYISGLPAKQIELAREVVPSAKRIGLLTNDVDPKGPPQTRELSGAIASLGLTAIPVNANQPSEIGAAFEKFAIENVDVVVVLQTNLLLLRRFVISDIALKHKMPTVYGYRENVVAGGMVSYGVNLSWCYTRGAYFVDRILKGAKPGDLPIEFPTSFWLAANIRAAKSLGMSLSPSLLARADEVIE
ncbi:ABC transporter substrate-binding protein [Bradyrhizobium sp. McL0616]|uniref:ABC transporter substrate-binding protein n=1 Tax=Bradyrhizobium sp. McL0616 TaxID=3415674 RepID=UPI003CE71533